MSQHMFLFEIGVEEMPIGDIENVSCQLPKMVEEKLRNARISFDKVRCYVTNRRIAVLIDAIAERQEKTFVQKRGPSESVAFQNGQPTKALLGFLNSNVATVEDIVVKEGYVYLYKEVEGQESQRVLPELFDAILQELSFSKPMRWGNGIYEFVRPVKWIVALFDEKILPIKAFGRISDKLSRAHPYLDKFVQIEHPSRYVEILRENFVLVDEHERIDKIKQQIENIQKSLGLSCDMDENLIEEISKITEYPLAIVSEFDEKYLQLPAELITVTIKHHLRSFTTRKGGKLSPKFIAFVDRPEGDMKKIVEGYRNVVNARLEDARYYFEMDLKKDFTHFNERLKGMVFQKELGTLYDKVERIAKLSDLILEELGLSNFREKILRAAWLSKFDLASHVVFEFPELQGTMGRIYALLKGEDEKIAQAIEEQYSSEPKSPITGVLSIADRIDTIVGNICIGNIPTGSKDPFGLRSKADTIYWIVEFNKWDLNLKNVLGSALQLLPVKCQAELLDEFFSSRFYAYMVNSGIRYDVARAVNHLWWTPLRGLLSSRAIMKTSESDEFNNLAIAFQRVHNITKNHTSDFYDGALFVEEAERELLNAFLQAKIEVSQYLEKLDYERAIQKLIALKPFIDRYFDEVFVMVDREDIRQNRLGFLKSVDALFMLVGDLSHLIKTQ